MYPDPRDFDGDTTLELAVWLTFVALLLLALVRANG